MSLKKGHDESLFTTIKENKTMVNHMNHKGNKSRNLKYILGGISETRKYSISLLLFQPGKRLLLGSW